MESKTVLLVEDSIPLRSVLAEKFRDAGFHVLEAGGGEEGLRLALEGHPDCIVTDVVMFPVDGLEMARRIRQSDDWGKHVHIIALTNQNDSEIEARLPDLHLDDYLVKAETGLDDVTKKVTAILRTKRSKSH